MKRFWFEFENIGYENLPAGVVIGCGITSNNYDDAIQILSEKVFKNYPIPKIVKLVEDIDISTLDTGHVKSNMSSPNLRGVWFPLGYE